MFPITIEGLSLKIVARLITESGVLFHTYHPYQFSRYRKYLEGWWIGYMTEKKLLDAVECFTTDLLRH